MPPMRGVATALGRTIAAFAFAALAAPAAAEPPHAFAPAAPPALSAGQRARLGAGEVVVRELPSEGDGIGVLMLGVVGAPPEQVWDVMADCDRQDEFLPRVLWSQVRDRAGDSHVCELVFDLPFPLDDPRTASIHRVRRLPDGGYQRWWRLLPGEWDYERNRGSWSVHPLDGGERSLLVSRMDLLPKSSFPAWMLRAAQSRQAPATFDAIRRRVRALHAAHTR
jgi:hypothetical protein